jgi:hypothetical protein
MYRGYSGASVAACTANSQVIPGGSTLYIQSLSIWSTSNEGADPYVGYLSITSPTNVYAFLPMVAQAGNSTTDSYVGHLQVPLSVPTYPIRAVSLNGNSTNAGTTIYCSVVGYLIPSS